MKNLHGTVVRLQAHVQKKQRLSYYLAVRLCIALRSCSNCFSSGGTGMSIGSLSESGFPVSFEIVSFFLFHTIELKSIIALVYFVISASSSTSSSSSSFLNISCLRMVVSLEYIFVQSSSTSSFLLLSSLVFAIYARPLTISI